MMNCALQLAGDCAHGRRSQTAATGTSGLARRRGPEHPIQNSNYLRSATKFKIENKAEIEFRAAMRSAGLLVSSETYGFSPVRIVLHVFHPISQPQGFDFSPVTRNALEKYIKVEK
jgi:hypothetical protein